MDRWRRGEERRKEYACNECTRRGIVTTWQSSLSLSIYLSLDTADFSTFRWTANLDNVFTESYEWTSNPRKNFILLPPRERMDPFYSRVSNLGGWIFSSSSLLVR